MRASAVVDAVSKVANATVTHSGTINTSGGRVDILADHGTVRVSGTIVGSKPISTETAETETATETPAEETSNANTPASPTTTETASTPSTAETPEPEAIAEPEVVVESEAAAEPAAVAEPAPTPAPATTTQTTPPSAVADTTPTPNTTVVVEVPKVPTAPDVGGAIFIGRDETTNVLAAVGDASGARLESVGGFVETSGRTLTIDNTRVSAKDWLLDPDNIQITNDASLTAGYTSKVSASDLGTSLSAGTNVTVATTSGNADSGNIYINSAVNKTGNSDATLTLVADNGIIMSSAIGVTSGDGKLNLNFTAHGKPGGVTPTAANADSLGIVIGGVGNMSLNGGNLTLTGTTYRGAEAGVKFMPVELTSAGAAANAGGATLNISAGNITINGTANTFAGSSGTGVYMTRYPNPVQLTATGNVNIIGTITGTGTGSGFESRSSGTNNSANSITAGGTLTLRGNNRASLTNPTAAVFADGGLHLRSVGHMVVQAEINNEAYNAISFTSNAGSASQANASFQSVNSSGTASGNVLIQSNRGGINFSNNLADAASSRAITGVNITIDNTGAGMATGVGNNVGSGGTTGGTIGSGSINASTGAITKGIGRVNNNAHNGVHLDGRTITASGNVNIYGVVLPHAGGGSGYGVQSAATISATNFSIQGEGINGGAWAAGGGAVRLNDGSSITGTATTGTNLIKGTWESAFGNSFAVVLGSAANSDISISSAAGAALNIEGRHAGNQTNIDGRYTAPGVLTQGTVKTQGTVNISGHAESHDGISMSGTFKHADGTLTLVGTSETDRSVQSSAAGVRINGSLTITDRSALTVRGTYTAKGNPNSNGSQAIGFINNGAITGNGGPLNITGTSTLLDSQTFDANNPARSVGILTNAAITGWGNTTLSASNDVRSVAPALQVMRNINVGNNALALQATNGGQVYQGGSSTLTAGRVSIDNTNGTIDATTGAITMGAAASTTSSTTRALDLNGAINTTGNIHMAANSGAYINSKLTSSNGNINVQAKGTTEFATGGVSNANNISASSSGGDIIQRAELTATEAVILDNRTATGRSISRSAGTITSNKVVLNAANQIGATDNRILVKTNQVVMQSAGNQFLTGSANTATGMTVAAKSTGGAVEVLGNGATTIGSVDGLDGISSNTGVKVLTSTGNLNIAKSVTNNTSGDVVLGAGVDSAAGQGLDSNIKTTPGATVNNGTSSVRVYTGSTTNTGKLEILHTSLANLALEGIDGSAQNAQTNTVYNNATAITDGAAVQAIFRDKVDFGGDQIASTAKVVTYGDATTANAALVDTVKAALKEANTGNAETTTGAGKFQLSKSTMIDNMAFENNEALSDKQLSSSDFLKANESANYKSSKLTTSQAGYSVGEVAQGTAQIKVNRKVLTLTGMSAQDKTFDGNTSAVVTGTPAFDSGGKADADEVDLDGNVAAIGTFANAAVGNNKSVTIVGGLKGNDADNYNLVQQTSANILPAVTPIDPVDPVNPVDPVDPVDPVGPVNPFIPAVSPSTAAAGAGGNLSSNRGTASLAPGLEAGFQLASAEQGQCTPDTLSFCECETAKDEDGLNIDGVQLCFEPQRAAELR
jgi:hypothetical protein